MSQNLIKMAKYKSIKQSPGFIILFIEHLYIYITCS